MAFAGSPLLRRFQGGTASDLLGQGLNTGNLTPSDYEYYFGNPRYFGENLMENLGFRTGVASTPYSDYLQSQANLLRPLVTAQGIIGGGNAPVSDITQNVGRALSLGGGVSDVGVLRGLANLQRMAREAPNTLSIGQQGLLGNLDLGGTAEQRRAAHDLFRSSLYSQTAPELRRGLGDTLEDIYSQYRRNQPNEPNLGFYEFLNRRL